MTTTPTTPTAERELRAEAVIDAPPDQVWRVLSDVSRMGEWSPELVKMVPLKRGGLRLGQWYLGINRRKGIVWPTRSVVCTLHAGRSLAWDVPTNGARWIWELNREGEGTRVVHRRPVPERLSWVANTFARLFLGGVEGHADELEAGMAQTVARLKAAVEG
jgi:uncharacterized protein YndB with AHSA1/START domain